MIYLRSFVSFVMLFRILTTQLPFNPFASVNWLVVQWLTATDHSHICVFFSQPLSMNLLWFRSARGPQTVAPCSLHTELTRSQGTSVGLKFIPPPHKVCLYDHFLSVWLKKKWHMLLNVKMPQMLHLEQWIVTDRLMGIMLSFTLKSITRRPVDWPG